MSDRPTPETDDAQWGTGKVTTDFARRLERDRDEARAWAEKLQRNACQHSIRAENAERERDELLAYLDAAHYATCNAELRRERKELQDELAALKRTAHWLFSRLSLHLAADQFAGTTLRLERIGEENPWLKESYIP